MSAETPIPFLMEIEIAVPRAYQDFLIRSSGLRHLGRFALPLGFLALTYYIVPATGAHHYHLFQPLLDTALVLLYMVIWYLFTARKPWRYVIDNRQMTFHLIEWKWGGRSWDWYTLTWSRDVVASITQEEWRGLPVLCLTTHAKKPQLRKKLVMVYAHEDHARVQSEILPLVERYRKRHRHDFWMQNT